MLRRGVKNAFEEDFFSLNNKKFDTILFLMNGAGMAQKIHRLQKMLEKAASLLTPAGSIYIESTDLLYMYEDEDGSALINLAGEYYGEVVYQLEYKNLKGKPFPWLFVDYENLSYIAELVDLECEMIYRGELFNYIARLTKNRSAV